MSNPTLYEGGVGVDNRGEVGYVNDFNFVGVKRFYWVSNHRSGFVRAWHAHRVEEKYVMVRKRKRSTKRKTKKLSK